MCHLTWKYRCVIVCNEALGRDGMMEVWEMDVLHVLFIDGSTRNNLRCDARPIGLGELVRDVEIQ